MSSADQDLFDAWFRFADADRDGVVGGADAVAFFSRSGLPQETLFKVNRSMGDDDDAFVLCLSLSRGECSLPLFASSRCDSDRAWSRRGLWNKTRVETRTEEGRFASFFFSFSSMAIASGRCSSVSLSRPQPPLSPPLAPQHHPQIWQAVAGDAPTLSRAQFYSSLRLIALAQKKGGALPEADAQRALMGLGPPLPAPAMSGLEALIGAPAASRDTWRPSYPGNAPQRAPPPPPPATTTAANAAASAAQPNSSSNTWPPLPRASAAAIRAEFARLDANGDGLVSGSEAAPALASSGAARDALRAVWACVAGDAGELTVSQFVAARYLAGLAATGGRAPPSALPPGKFPPEEEEEEEGGGANGGATTAGAWEAFSDSAPQLPPLPAKERGGEDASFSSVVPRPSALPPLPPIIGDGTGADEQGELSRLRAEREAAAAADATLAAAEAAAALAASREKAFTQALSELKIFQARVSAATLQAQQRAEADKVEADEAEKRYEEAWASASTEHARAREALDSLTREKARKLEASTKLDELKRDIERLATISPDAAAVEAAETRRLLGEIAAAEAQRARLAQREEKRLKACKLQAERAQKLREAVAEAEKVAKKGGEEGGDEKVDAEAVNAAAAALAAAAAAAGVTLSKSSSASNPSSSPLEFDALAAADAADWDEWKDEGYDVVDALPPVQSEDEDGEEGEEDEEKVEVEEEEETKAGATAAEGDAEDAEDDDEDGSQATTEAAAVPAVEKETSSSAPVAMEEEEGKANEDEAPAAGWASF